MLGRRRRATSTQRRSDVGPTSHGRYRPNVGPTHVPLQFFSLHNLPELLCAEIIPMLEAAINSGPVLGMVTDLLYNNQLTWKFDSYHILRPRQNDRHFSRRHFQMHFLECKYMNFDWISLKFVCKGPIDNIYQRWFRLMAWRRPATSHYPFVHCFWVSLYILETEQSHL